MITYRIANQEGRGPYQSSYLTYEVQRTLQPMYNVHCGGFGGHPTPQCDYPGYWMHEDDLCAFSSQAQLLDWFDGFEELLDCAGFLVWEYETTDYMTVELQRQTIIRKRDMRLRAVYRLV